MKQQISNNRAAIVDVADGRRDVITQTRCKFKKYYYILYKDIVNILGICLNLDTLSYTK